MDAQEYSAHACDGMQAHTAGERGGNAGVRQLFTMDEDFDGAVVGEEDEDSAAGEEHGAEDLAAEEPAMTGEINIRDDALMPSGLSPIPKEESTPRKPPQRVRTAAAPPRRALPEQEMAIADIAEEESDCLHSSSPSIFSSTLHAGDQDGSAGLQVPAARESACDSALGLSDVHGESPCALVSADAQTQDLGAQNVSGFIAGAGLGSRSGKAPEDCEKNCDDNDKSYVDSILPSVPAGEECAGAEGGVQTEHSIFQSAARFPMQQEEQQQQQQQDDCKVRHGLHASSPKAPPHRDVPMLQQENASASALGLDVHSESLRGEGRAGAEGGVQAEESSLESAARFPLQQQQDEAPPRHDVEALQALHEQEMQALQERYDDLHRNYAALQIEIASAVERKEVQGPCARMGDTCPEEEGKTKEENGDGGDVRSAIMASTIQASEESDRVGKVYAHHSPALPTPSSRSSPPASPVHQDVPELLQRISELEGAWEASKRDYAQLRGDYDSALLRVQQMQARDLERQLEYTHKDTMSQSPHPVAAAAAVTPAHSEVGLPEQETEQDCGDGGGGAGFKQVTSKADYLLGVTADGGGAKDATRGLAAGGGGGGGGGIDLWSSVSSHTGRTLFRCAGMM